MKDRLRAAAAYLQAQLNDASTWRAIMRLLTAAGIVSKTVDVETAITLLLVVNGVIGAVFKDKLKSPL